MNFKKILVGCAAVLFLNACTPSLIQVEEHNANRTQYPSYVTDIQRRTNPNGLLEVQVSLQSSRSRTINYKIEWLDEQGYALRNPIDERYRALRLTRNENHVMHKVASDKRARDIKIYIK